MPDPIHATAYGPDRPIADGSRNPTDATVIVLSDLDVNDDQPVQVMVQTGRGDWDDQAGQVITVNRVQLGHIRRPGRDARAAIAARLAMSALASRMDPDRCRRGSVAYWDMRASMDDQRAALCLATGIPADKISRDGYDLSRPDARQFHADRCASYGAKP